jgi:hypothetical protein
MSYIEAEAAQENSLASPLVNECDRQWMRMLDAMLSVLTC